MKKLRLYFNEFNLLMGSGGVVYLPLVSGILSAYIKTSKLVRDNVEVQPFIFRPDTHQQILNSYSNPDIACFSIAMWNEQLSLKVAKGIKEQFPHSKIIFGGAQCPHVPTQYMQEHPFIDFCVRAEGEDAFLELCEKLIEDSQEFHQIPNLAYWKNGEVVVNEERPTFNKSLDLYPSPYLTGEFDYLLTEDHSFQAIIETNRGCPFLCTYCYWGRGGTTQKYRFRDLETVFKEIDFFAKNKIEYVFNADSNFGMHKRDYDIALKLVENKKRFGYPEKFRTCWGKNSSERIFRIATLLHLNGIDKGVTLARQSNSPTVLKLVKRDNIKLQAYSTLQERFNTIDIPVYAEMILGLPGETYDSWKNGLDELLETGLNNQLFVYMAEVYPNTELADPGYQEKYKIQTARIQLSEIHCSPRQQNWLDEYQHIVVETFSMSRRDWQRMVVFSVLTMLMHSMKLGYYVLIYLHFINGLKYSDIIEAVMRSKRSFLAGLIELIHEYTENILSGKGRGVLLPDYSDVYLDIEELIFLKVTENPEQFYSELSEELLSSFDETDVIDFMEAIRFQKAMVPFFKTTTDTIELQFGKDYPSFFYQIRFGGDGVIENKPARVSIEREGYLSKHKFTTSRLIRARKSGTILYESDVFLDMLEEKKRMVNVETPDQEKLASIKLFDKTNKFEKFNTLKAPN